MESLDLRTAPPRSPHEELAGLCMLPRTIDKLRASLPGGHLGAYQIAGFSARMMEALGISEADLRDVVARAADDAEVAAWIREHTDASAYQAINESLKGITIGDRLERPDFLERYPGAAEFSPQTSMFDLLDADDARMFA